jgi:hypothetical protein
MELLSGVRYSLGTGWPVHRTTCSRVVSCLYVLVRRGHLELQGMDRSGTSWCKACPRALEVVLFGEAAVVDQRACDASEIARAVARPTTRRFQRPFRERLR